MTKKIIWAAVVVIVVVIGGILIFNGSPQAPADSSEPEESGLEGILPEAPAAEEEGLSVRELSVSGSEFSFSPSSASVRPGERIRLVFQNVGRAPHNWTIEGLGVATKTIIGGQTDTVEFVGPESGIFTVFCSVPGHREAGMAGSLIIE